MAGCSPLPHLGNTKELLVWLLELDELVTVKETGACPLKYDPVARTLSFSTSDVGYRVETCWGLECGGWKTFDGSKVNKVHGFLAVAEKKPRFESWIHSLWDARSKGVVAHLLAHQIGHKAVTSSVEPA